MNLSPGTRLGSYEITGVLGAGGMGEVYRARDTKLNRDVAIKIFFFSGDSFSEVPIALGTSATWGAQVHIPNVPSTHTAISPRNYDVSPDGREFVWTQAADAASTSPATPGPFLHVVLNWFDELKARVPGK